MSLRPVGAVGLPAHVGRGGFDHGDVHPPTGRVFIAHTANGTVEVVDGPGLEHIATIPGCSEASGALCSPDGEWVIAAARGAGHILFIDPQSLDVKHAVAVGGRPNGLAWDSRRRRVLVADVARDQLTIVDADGGDVTITTALPGRPRWAVYDEARDRYLVNVRTPAVVAVIAADTGQVSGQWPISSEGPHGLDIDGASGRAFVACDGGSLVVVDLGAGEEVGSLQIAGGPDAIWYDAVSAAVFVAIGNPGVLQVADAGAMTIESTFETEAGTQTTALDRERRRLYAFQPLSCSMVAWVIE